MSANSGGDEAPAGPERSGPSPLRTAFWWVLTLLILMVLDDLTFGPAFWALSRLVGPWVAVGAVYAVYVPVQVWLVGRGTVAEPGPVAGWFLDRFGLSRRFEAVRRNELALHSRVVGVVSSSVLSLVIGGVLPPLLLWRQGWPKPAVRRVSVLTAFVYATEFALLHGLLPSTV